MAKRKKPKFYVVWEGARPGVYTNWPDCQQQVQGYPGARYKSFGSMAEAKAAFAGESADFIGASANPPIPTWTPGMEGGPVLPSWSVDAACSGNPGLMEYRGVVTETGEELFHVGPLDNGTNNIGEFLALVHALALLQKEESNLPIYTDSRTAMAWVRNKRTKTKLEQDESNSRIFELISRAEDWLRNHTFENPIMKWDTDSWGEVPADFGRK